MSTIIKSGESGGDDRQLRCTAFNFDDLAEKASRRILHAQRQAEQILAQARQEAKKIRSEAADQGRADAENRAQQQAAAKARQDLDRRLQTLRPALEEAMREIRQSKEGWLLHWEKNAVRLAAAIARRVIRREVERTPEIAADLIREALELAAGADRVTLHLNPRDYETLGRQAGELAAPLGRAVEATFEPDPGVSPGGCRLTTEFGEIDQRVETQLARIEEELTG